MLTAADTVRAHTIARAIAPAFPTYRAAYAVAASHVAGSKRSSRTVRPASSIAAHMRYWAAAALVTAAAWMSCPAIAAAAN